MANDNDARISDTEEAMGMQNSKGINKQKMDPFRSLKTTLLKNLNYQKHTSKMDLKGDEFAQTKECSLESDDIKQNRDITVTSTVGEVVRQLEDSVDSVDDLARVTFEYERRENDELDDDAFDSDSSDRTETGEKKQGRSMEWQIMNCGGLNSLVVGTWVDGEYQVSDDCYETLSSILDRLKEDEQTTRRQLAASQIIQKDLVPLLLAIEDDPEVFSMTVKLLVSLTQPMEYLQPGGGGSPDQKLGSRLQFWEIGKMLLDAKAQCTEPKFTWALMSEVKKIIIDTGQCNMEERDCETINQCLLLVRNLLYIQDTTGGGGLTSVHLSFLRNLFQMGIDYIIMFVLNAKQKEYFGATVVQVLSLLYRDLVGEIFLRFDNTSKCWDVPCDSSNCSACEAAMDRSSILEPYMKTLTYRSSRSPKCSKCGAGQEASQQSSAEQSSSGSGSGSGSQSPVLVERFDKMCTMTESIDIKKWKSDKQKMLIEDSSDDRVSSVSSSDSPETLQSYDSLESSVMEELGTHLVDFTTKFIQEGFSNLVHILKVLLMNKDDGSQTKLDDSYFLWSISFFLKFARRKELNVEFKNIKGVFTADVVGFLVYKAFSNGEEVFFLSKNKVSNGLAMKRLHLCVSALRELFKTLTHQMTKMLSDEDKLYLNNFQRSLANMCDLRQLFLWLIRHFDADVHTDQFLQDTVITNHYFLLLLEIWIAQKLCVDPRVNMLTHISQFATPCIMKNYGHLLKDFGRNDHHVNNCIFTMMHHVAGDCQQPDALLHVNILNTFLEIWDSDYPVTQVMNDLMEYVIQKFISKAEKAPLECALQLFVEGEEEQEEESMVEEDSEKMDEGCWTVEEEDKLVMWYTELEGDPNVVEKIIDNFDELGIHKTKIEIVNKLYEANWMAHNDVESMMKFDKDLQGIQDCEEPESEVTLQFLGELIKIEEGENTSLMDFSSLEEDKVVSHLVDNIQRQGLGKQLKFVQRTLLEAAYVKLDKRDDGKGQLEEPIIKHCIDVEQPIPLAPFSDDLDVVCSNLAMQLLLQQLGFFVHEDGRSPYPRMPHYWTVTELMEKARMLGDIDQDDVKFKLSSVIEEGTTNIINNMDRISIPGLNV